MSFTFHVEKPKVLKDTFVKLRQLLAEKDCSLEGDEANGRIVWSDGVEGIYHVKENSIEITIQKNPFKIKKPVELYIRRVFRKIVREIDSYGL